jgi:hypothetical protein
MLRLGVYRWHIEPGPIDMRERAAAAVVNAVLVLAGPLAVLWLEHARLDTAIDGLTFGRNAAILLPFAGFAGWRTWVHAARRRAGRATLWQPVAEAAATALVVALLSLAPGILTRPADAPAYVLVYGGGALMLGAITGVILRTTAVLTLALHGWWFADSVRRRGGTTP